jgi:hypoxanthine phosphoribosyltransferase
MDALFGARLNLSHNKRIGYPREPRVNDIITWSGWVLAILGLAGTIYYGRKSERSQLRLQSVEWKEIEAAASFLAQRLSKFDPPALFLATDSRGGIIARLIGEKIGTDVPILIGVSREITSKDVELPWTGYIRINTHRWAYLLPASIDDFKSKRIAIIDDVTFTGETIHEVKRKLKDLGYDDIVTGTVLASEISIKQNLSPDYFWATTTHAEIAFPWGRMR